MKLGPSAWIATCLALGGVPVGAQTTSPRAATYPNPTAAMRAARERADSLARQVVKITVVPDHLEFQLGDSVYSGDAWLPLEITGFDASGDSVPGFAKMFALKPGPVLQYSGQDLVARQRGTTELWIYIGLDRNRRFFSDTARSARVKISVR